MFQDRAVKSTFEEALRAQSDLGGALDRYRRAIRAFKSAALKAGDQGALAYGDGWALAVEGAMHGMFQALSEVEDARKTREKGETI